MRGVARHIRVRGAPLTAASQLPVKTGENNSCNSSTSFNSCERWRPSGTRSSRLNSFPGPRDLNSFSGSRDLDSISWDSSVQLRHHVALVPNFYQTTPSIISFHHTPLANGKCFIFFEKEKMLVNFLKDCVFFRWQQIKGPN